MKYIYFNLSSIDDWYLNKPSFRTDWYIIRLGEVQNVRWILIILKITNSYYWMLKHLWFEMLCNRVLSNGGSRGYKVGNFFCRRQHKTGCCQTLLPNSATKLWYTVSISTISLLKTRTRPFARMQTTENYWELENYSKNRVNLCYAAY